MVLAAAVTAATAISTGGVSAGSSGGATSVEGFNGKTIIVAGLATASEFPNVQVGAEARFAYANAHNQLHGIKIDFVTEDDDQYSPAVALTDARQLVNEDHVFAVVPDLSPVNPGSYFASQHVIQVGAAYSSSGFCTPKPSTKVWAFGYVGCQVPLDAPVASDTEFEIYKYAVAQTGLKHPTVVVLSASSASGKISVTDVGSSAEADGLKVVSINANLPATGVTDFSPYITQYITANGGKAPDVIDCEATTECISIWEGLKADGYKGIFDEPLGPIRALASSFKGALTTSVYNPEPNAGLTQMTNEIEAYSPGTTLTGYSNVVAWFAADMFIKAIQKVQKAGEAITADNVQKALATNTYEIKDLIGPYNYPASTVVSSPSCFELALDTGTSYTDVEPYACSTHQAKLLHNLPSAS